MDRYSGMNRVEATVSENREIVKNDSVKEKKRGGFLKCLCVQAAIAILLGCALFAGKAFFSSAAVGKVKAVYAFDAVEYVSELLDKDK